MEKDFIVYAHRGASEYAPENTLMSFYLGVHMGANGIETDVQRTKDGVLVLFHDDTIDRVTDGKGNVCDYTLEQLKQFTVMKNGRKDKIITLEEFLVRFGWMDLTFAIELKAKGVAKDTVDLIKKYNVQEKVIITSFDYGNLLDCTKYAPEIRTGYLIFDVNEKVLEEIKTLSLYELCPKAEYIDNNFVCEWNKKGYNVRAWGISNEDIMKKAYDDGVGGMTVNFPDKLIEYIK